jgi:hypothetical protein
MTDLVKIAIIAAVPGTIAAFMSYINGKKADRLAVSVDGRLTQLLEGKDAKNAATAISSHAEGVLEEKNRNKEIT